MTEGWGWFRWMEKSMAHPGQTLVLSAPFEGDCPGSPFKEPGNGRIKEE